MRYLKEHHETNGQKLEKAGSHGIIVIFSNKIIPVKKKKTHSLFLSLSLSLLLDGRKAQEKEDFCTQCMPTTWNDLLLQKGMEIETIGSIKMNETCFQMTEVEEYRFRDLSA